MEILILVVVVAVAIAGWRLFGGASQPSGGSPGSTSGPASTTTAASDDPLAATNGLEEVLLRAAHTVSLRLSTGADFAPDLEAMAPEVAGAAAGLRDTGDVDAIGTARSFFVTHVLVNLQAQPNLMAGAKATVARAEIWVDDVLGSYLDSEPETRSHNLSKEVADADVMYRTAQQAWSAAGLNIAIHGPGSADELVEMMSRRLPDLRGEPYGPFVELVEPNMRLWMCLVEGSSGIACVISEVTRPEDGEFDSTVLSEIIPADVLNSSESSTDDQDDWEATTFSRGATDSTTLAERLQNGRLLPPDRLGSLVR